ncbi:hypothetical protein T4E_1252 [Trichinella pseudospiralis]|uniref:Uncharacterized protein n=1 Tax=Trichinella pseudospiralis TaxID=6337 RepID=A0A0V0Y8A7_TRIPS|nr:hypothetical protein T4E_1252 [Trichinella pseudospiralis]
MQTENVNSFWYTVITVRTFVLFCEKFAGKSFLLLFLILDDRRYKYEGYKLLLKINFQLYATLTISNSIDKMM